MNDSSAGDPCRLLIRAPERSFEIAAPVEVPLSEIIPTLVLYAEGDDGEDLDEAGLEHDGWVLQQLGDEPLEEDETLSSLGLCHGETLYLRPRRDQLPPVHFDDIVDGVANGIAERPDKWEPTHLRVLLQVLGLVVLLTGLVVMAGAGLVLSTAIGAAASALLMLASAWAASRAMGDLTAAQGLAGTATLAMGLAGACVPTGEPGTTLLGATVLTASLTAAGASVLGVAAVAGAIPFFTGLFIVEALGVIAGLSLMFLPGTSSAEAAALVGTVALFLGTYAPQLAFRLAGLRMPALPANPEQLQEDIDPFPARRVLDRTALADRFQTSLYASTGLVLAVCLTLLSTGEGWVPKTLSVIMCLVMLLQTRGLTSARQRILMTVPPWAGLMVLAVDLAWSSDPVQRLLAVVGLFTVTTVLAVISWSLPGRRAIPHWGRAAEILQSVLAVAIVPLLLALYGVYGLLRGIGG